MCDPPDHHISVPHIMAGMTVDVASWSKVLGDSPFLLGMCQRKREALRAVADADAA